MGDVRVVPYLADEKEMLVETLEQQREAAAAICEGCSDEDLRRHMVSSPSTILGILKHLALVEHWWVHVVFAGDPLGDPVSTEEDPDADFRVEPHESTADILDLYESNCARSREIVAAADLDDTCEDPRASAKKTMNLRWIVLRMIAETARHAGHMDILRELADGVTEKGHAGTAQPLTAEEAEDV